MGLAQAFGELVEARAPHGPGGNGAGMIAIETPGAHHGAAAWIELLESLFEELLHVVETHGAGVEHLGVVAGDQQVEHHQVGPGALHIGIQHT